LNAEPQIEALTECRIDIGVWRTPLVTGDHITSTRLASETICVALPAGHPLERRRPLRLEHLAGEPMVMIDPQTSRLGRQLFETCSAAGFEPRVAHFATEPITRMVVATRHMARRQLSITGRRCTARRRLYGAPDGRPVYGRGQLPSFGG
jgi:DNA-binding transcriptional LysR family regulator